MRSRHKIRGHLSCLILQEAGPNKWDITRYDKTEFMKEEERAERDNIKAEATVLDKADATSCS